MHSLPSCFCSTCCKFTLRMLPPLSQLRTTHARIFARNFRTDAICKCCNVAMPNGPFDSIPMFGRIDQCWADVPTVRRFCKTQHRPKHGPILANFSDCWSGLAKSTAAASSPNFGQILASGAVCSKTSGHLFADRLSCQGSPSRMCGEQIFCHCCIGSLCPSPLEACRRQDPFRPKWAWIRPNLVVTAGFVDGIWGPLYSAPPQSAISWGEFDGTWSPSPDASARRICWCSSCSTRGATSGSAAETG